MKNRIITLTVEDEETFKRINVKTTTDELNALHDTVGIDGLHSMLRQSIYALDKSIEQDKLDKLKNTKIFIGPMSKNVVDSVIEYCNDNNVNIGLIPSRRQVENTGGYVNNWTTKEFCEYVKSKTD